MRLIVKPLKGEPLTLEQVEMTTTVGELRDKIHVIKPEWERNLLKIISNGKILKDDTKTLEDYKYKSPLPLVVVPGKPKKQKMKKDPVTTPAKTPAVGSVSTPVATTTPAATTTTAATPAAPAPVGMERVLSLVGILV